MIEKGISANNYYVLMEAEDCIPKLKTQVLKKAAINTLDNIIVKRPSSKINKKRQNLCLDKGYDFQEIENEVIKKGYLPHIPHRGGEQAIENGSNHNHIKRRWVVERTNSWHNRFRKLLIRYKKKLENYFELVCLSCCILIYRRIILG
ncbi:MAG: transposase [Nitrososphaeraceae archaeon]